MFQKSLTVKDKDDILLLEIKALSKSKGGFVMEVIVADQIIMGLILNAGDAKQEAHNLQTQFLAQEAGGTKTEITALFVHSQDHLMTSITEINLIKEMIDLRKELSAKQ